MSSAAIASNRPRAPRPPEPALDRDEYSERDLLALYLHEAGGVELLSPERERALFQTLHHGAATERAAARDQLIAANVRLVVSVARRYAGLGMSLPELIAEGNIGLIQAVDRFEPVRGHRFSTFARWPIRKAITRALDDRGRLVRLPANSWQALRALRCAEQQLPDTMGREPTTAELAAACGVASWRFDALRGAATPPASLDARLGPDDDATLGDVLDSGAEQLPDTTARHMVRERLHELLDTLPSRERELLILRHGLDGAAPRTLQQVGNSLGISGERTRQLEARALSQLRQHPLTVTLTGALD